MLTSSGACCGRRGCWRRRRGYAAGQIARPAYKSIKDRAVDEAVAQQEEAGLTVLTDGEMRRLSFQSQMVQAVDGFGEWDLGAFLWGDWHGHEEVGDSRRERPKDLGVVAPLRRHRSLSAEEFVYLRARTARTLKVTLPSPGLFANFWPPERSRGAYASLESFLEDVARILREEVYELAEYGASCSTAVDRTAKNGAASCFRSSPAVQAMSSQHSPAGRRGRILRTPEAQVRRILGSEPPSS
jgi:methionine synthase II (cobalamin-independent)